MIKKRLFWGLIILIISLFPFWGWAETGTYVKVINLFSSVFDGCWFCGVFKTLFTAMDQMAYTISTNMKDQFIKLLGIFLFICAAELLLDIILILLNKLFNNLYKNKIF